MNIKVCKYCGKRFDIDTEEFVKPNKTRYAHKRCHEDFLARGNTLKKEATMAEAPKREVICLYCNEKFFLEDENFLKPRLNRYAHKECYEKHFTKDESYIDVIYQVLSKAGVKYNYQMCERQRLRFLKDGYTNEGISEALRFFYEKNTSDPNKANGGIGIVPYVYDEAKEYFDKMRKRKTARREAFQARQEVKAITIVAPKKKEKERKNKFSLEDLE